MNWEKGNIYPWGGNYTQDKLLTNGPDPDYSVQSAGKAAGLSNPLRI